MWYNMAEMPTVLRITSEKVRVTEEKGHKEVIRNTICAQRRAPIQRGRNEWYTSQPA